MEELDDAAVEEGVEHLRHRHQQDRGGEIGAAHRHGPHLTPAPRLWEKSDQLLFRWAGWRSAPAPCKILRRERSMNDSFGSRATLRVGGRELQIARLDAL